MMEMCTDVDGDGLAAYPTVTNGDISNLITGTTVYVTMALIDRDGKDIGKYAVPGRVDGEAGNKVVKIFKTNMWVSLNVEPLTSVVWRSP